MKDSFGTEFKKDYSALKIVCYLCGKKNHVFLDCSEFSTIVGNIWKKVDRIKSILF